MIRREFIGRALIASLYSSKITLGQNSDTVSHARRRVAIFPPSEEFVETLPRLADLSRAPGIGIGIVQNGKVNWQHFGGLADAQSGRRIAEDSVFPAASMGKTIFAYAILKLADEKNIDLDRPIKDYLTEDVPTGAWGEKVTARHCLSHTSGFPNWRYAKTEPLVCSFEPGTQWQYSGEGYYTLQRCVENITGVGFEHFIQERVFLPLGMTSSTYIWHEDFLSRIVVGNDFGNHSHARWTFPTALLQKIKESGIPLKDWNHQRVAAAMNNPTDADIYPSCAFSLLTTVNDYTQFAARLAKPRGDNLDLLPATRAQFFNPFVKVTENVSWGVGIGVEQQDGSQFNLQSGDNGFWKNMMMVHPTTRSAIVVFTNGESGMRVVQRVMKAATAIDHDIFLLM